MRDFANDTRREAVMRRIRHRALFYYRQSLLPQVPISLRGWWARGQAGY